jgi:malate synthase
MTRSMALLTSGSTVPARVLTSGLSVDAGFHAFVTEEALPGSGVDGDVFWAGTARLLDRFRDTNVQLLKRRAQLQAQIDRFWLEAGGSIEQSRQLEFLRTIGYVEPAPAPFTIETSRVDEEIAVHAGPQLVVPLSNARFALNAANARWGSLYDSLYGSDVIPEIHGQMRTAEYNPTRGAAVISKCRRFLDETIPLEGASHADATRYSVDTRGLAVFVGREARLRDPSQFSGYSGDASAPDRLLFTHHGLRLELQFDPASAVGSVDDAGISDVLLESALTTIMDLEDSVAAVDASDKVNAYRNWLGLMRGDLTEEVTKGGFTFVRSLQPDRFFTSPAGAAIVIPGLALLMVRHCGLTMTTDAILDETGGEVPEGLLDAITTGLAALHDLRRPGGARNTRFGSMYVVKPKLHGPDEVAFSCDVLEAVEEILGMDRCTIKLGIMDEERRTSTNLAACIHAARERVVFINTGFLDRTGDEIRTSTHAGPMVRKADMREQPWLRAYEDHNVDVGLAAGFVGKAQIGKGMWAAPDNLADMVEQKIVHPQSGATCAWVPSPTAATLHALHYHQVDVRRRQQVLSSRPTPELSELLTVPLAVPAAWTPADVQSELDNNLQGLLGYVVKWINSGVGCSKVPDINGIPLMEDRATCRISSQHVANWLHHDVVSREQVEESLRRIAVLVDAQNAGDPDYEAMAPTFDGEAFAAARALIFEAHRTPGGYTEPVLYAFRRARKQRLT